MENKRIIYNALETLQKMYIIPKNNQFSLQLRFVSRTALERLKKGASSALSSRLTINKINDKVFELNIKLRHYEVDVLLVLFDLNKDTYTKYFHIPAIIGFSGPRIIRKPVLYRLYRMGISKGWISQTDFKRSVDALIEKVSRHIDGRSELISMVYRTVSYIGPRRLTLGATANFWPKGVEKLSDVLEKYFEHIYYFNERHHIFIKSLRYRLLDNSGVELGTYSISSSSLITIETRPITPRLKAFAKNLATELFALAIKNYEAKRVGYKVIEEKYGKLELYGTSGFRKIFLKAINEGKEFYENAKLIALKPQVHNPNLIAVPYEIGNPRTEVHIIDKKTGEIASLVVSYKGIMIVPITEGELSPGFIEQIQRLFEGLYKEE